MHTNPAFLVVAALGLASVSCGDGNGARSDLGTSALSQAEIDTLLFTREEEKLARDVYLGLAGHGVIFTNISGSERQHMDAMKVLLDRYSLDDPAAGLADGEFQNASLAALYPTLMGEGAKSALAAFGVGATIEELDIRDLRRARPDVTHTDILTTYANLERGSRNHLRTFHGQIVAVGGSFVPEYLSQEEFDAIVTTPAEHGPP